MTEEDILSGIRTQETVIEAEIQRVIDTTGIRREKLLAPTKDEPHVTLARQMLMYRLRAVHGLTYSRIGRALDRDHTSVIHGVRVIAAKLEKAA